MVLDRWSVHRAAARQILASGTKDIVFEWLPAYAPELNPVEARWGQTKFGDLANFVPDDTPHLEQAVHTSLTKQSHNAHLKASYFKTAQLRI